MAKYKFGVNIFPHLRWPVAWYNPLVLWQSIRRISSTQDELQNLDRRELFQGEFKAIEFRQHEQEDFWWDFLSDTGDGGNASYSLARALQATHLAVAEPEGAKTIYPRGALLVLGGDLAYPGANTEEYQYRFTELWEAARPEPEALPTPLLAIPQNHDWFDNLSTFNRLFIADYSNQFLGLENQAANSRQTRSYFAAQLPRGWWLLGLDFALNGDIDRKQFEAFWAMIEQKIIPPGSNIILLYPEPYWTRTLGDAAREGYPRRYQRLEQFILDSGLRLRLHLAGDYHHYVREVSATDTLSVAMDYQDMLITCGSGGAFLHPTHARAVSRTKVLDAQRENNAMSADLVKRLRVGSVDQLTPGQREYQRASAYPDEATSRCLSLGNIWALFKPAAKLEFSVSQLFSRDNADKILSGNILFALLLGAVYGLVLLGALPGIKGSWLALSQQGYGSALLSVMLAFLKGPVSLLGIVVLYVICNYLASEDGNKLGKCIAVAHTLVHAWVMASILYLCLYLTQCDGFNFLRWSWPVLAAVIGLMLFCLYLVNSGRKLSAVSGAGLLAIAHLLAMAWVLFLCQRFAQHSLANYWLFVFLLCFLSGGLVFGLYFALMALLGLQANNAFSPLACDKYKGFLRFKIDAQGNLHGYMLGTDEVPQQWVMAGESSRRPLWTESPGQQPPLWKLRDKFVLKR